MKKLIFILIFFLVGCASVEKVNETYYNKCELIKNNNMLFMLVKVNDKNCVLLIDSGSSRSLLDINKAKKYGFKYKKSSNKYVGIGGKEDLYNIYNYKIDKFHIDFLAIDLSNISAHFSENDVDLVGVIGSDFLNQHECIIDFRTNILYYKK